MISTTRNLNQILPSTKKFLCRTSHTLDPKSINWGQLGFGYVPTNCSLILEHQDGVWSKTFKQSEPYIKIHLLSNVLHYGQALFEGLKAFHTKDKKVVIFNPIENAQRMKNGAKRLGMPDIDTDVFIKAMENIVKLNLDFVPPYGTGGSLYLRPFYFGHGAKLGLGKAPEYCFGVISSPVGLYYPTGLKAVDAMVVERYDRAAPLGVGNVKVAGNYAADIVPAAESAAMGYPISLYLDALHHKYVEEFSTSNFIAISKDKKKYVTPLSDSVLPSITNKMLRKIAEKKGLKIEQRPIEFEEIANGEFSEVAACGTAVIVTPIKSITKGKLKVKLNEKLDVLEGLYNDIRALQTGEKPDEFGWRHYVCDK